MTSKLKRVSANTETIVNTLAEREGRTFVAQLDRVVEAGLIAMGEAQPEQPEPAKKTTTAKKAPAKKAEPKTTPTAPTPEPAGAPA